MHPITPPPIQGPESLGELTRLVTYSFATVSASLEAMSGRLDKLVTAEKHESDLREIKRSMEDLERSHTEDKAVLSAERASEKAAAELSHARSVSTRRWTIGSAIAFLGVSVPTLSEFLMKLAGS